MSADADGLARQLERRWTTLRAPTGQGATVIDLPTTTANGEVLLGRTVSGRSLFIPFPPDRHLEFKDDRRSRAVHLVRRPFDRPEGHRWYAELACLDHVLEPVFTSLCVDLLLRLERGDEDPVLVTLRILRSWRALFASAGRPLTVPQLAGLFGELLVLRRILARNAAAGPCWRGPFREIHDFRAGGTAVEVKTIVGGDARRFRVHGVRQLEAPDDGTLTLALFQVDTDPGAGLTVPDLVQQLVPIGGTPVAAGLAAVGYRTEDTDTYERHPFVVTSEEWFAVGPGFPRIVPGSFTAGATPAGTSDVHYDVDLASVALLPLSDGAIDEVLEELS